MSHTSSVSPYIVSIPKELLLLILGDLDMASLASLLMVLGTNNTQNCDSCLVIVKILLRCRTKDVVRGSKTILGPDRYIFDHIVQLQKLDERIVNLYRISAIANGHTNILNDMFPLHIPIDLSDEEFDIINEQYEKYMNIVGLIAAATGYLDGVKRIIEKDNNAITTVIGNAAENGHLDIVKYLYLLSPEILRPDLYVKAAMNGHFHVVKWLYENNVSFDILVGSDAAKSGNFEMLKWFHQKGCQLTTYMFVVTVEYGDLEMLKWLRSDENKCPWDARACKMAVRCGKFEVLQWLRSSEDQCPWDSTACSNAAANDDFVTLKWLYKNGCPWGEWACKYAAQNGNLEMLKYLHENGCQWNEKYICRDAIKNGHLEVLKYLHQNGCLLDKAIGNDIPTSNSIEVLKYLRENGCSWNEVTCEAVAENGNLVHRFFRIAVVKLLYRT